MAKLNIPKNYLDLTLDELLSTIFGTNQLICIESYKIKKPQDYKKVIHVINEILPENFQVDFMDVTEDEDDENKWIIELGIEDITAEIPLQQEEDKIEDRVLVDGMNKIFHKSKADFKLFSYWDSEWDSHSLGFGLVSKSNIKELLNLIKSRKENDWFELFYISE